MTNNITLEDSNKFNDILSNLPQGTLDNIIKRLERAMTNLHNNYAIGLIQFNHDVNTKWDSKKAYTNSKAQLERLNATSADLKNVKKYGVELLEAIEKQPETDAQYIYQQLATAMFDILQTRISESPYEDLVNTSGRYPAVTPVFRILKSNIMSDFNKVFGNNSTKIYSSNESLSDIANASNEALLTYIYNQIQHNQIHWSFIILMGMMLIYRFGYIYQQYKKGDRSALSTIFWIILGVVLALLISFLIGR